MVPPGEVTWRRRSAGSSPLSASSAAAPAMVARARAAPLGGQAGGDAGGLQRLDEGVEIGRRRAGDGVAACISVLVVQVDHRRHGVEQGVGARRGPRRRRRRCWRCPCRSATPVVGITRATRAAAEGRGEVGGARRRRRSRRRPRPAPACGATSAATSRQTCGLHRQHHGLRLGQRPRRVGIERARRDGQRRRPPGCGSRMIRSDGANAPGAQPAVDQRPAHAAGAEEQDRRHRAGSRSGLADGLEHAGGHGVLRATCRPSAGSRTPDRSGRPPPSPRRSSRRPGPASAARRAAGQARGGTPPRRRRSRPRSGRARCAG